jgi:hypothetical protein
MAHFTNSNSTMISRSVAAVARAIDKARHRLFDSYQPELHYMRGPGPKWHAKHACISVERDLRS